MPNKILVVDDEPVQRRLLEATLEKLGFEPDRAIVDHNPTRKCDVTCNQVVLTRERFESLFGSLDTSAAA